MLEPFLSAVPVLEKMEAAGFDAFFVGGSVRDFLLGKDISDVDIATSATPDEVKQVFPKTIDIGIEHGTVLVLYQNQKYEITTFRTEAEYEDFRRPKEVTFIRNLTDDLQRRDFTMNAIAMDKSGKLIDPFEGQIAIKHKVIKTVGNPYERFQEDALRMMRAVRFVSQLSFQMDEATLSALKDLVHLLGKIAVERKLAEMNKLLSGWDRKQAIQFILDTNLFSYLPGLANRKNQFQRMLDYEINHLNLREMWALIGYCLQLEGKAMEDFLRDWRHPLKEIREIQQILYYLNRRFKQEWSKYDLYLAAKETFIATETLYLVLKGIGDNESIERGIKEYEKLPLQNRSEMDVTGNDLMTWFNQSGGPWLKEMLNKVEEAIIKGTLTNNKQSIKEWLMGCNHK